MKAINRLITNTTSQAADKVCRFVLDDIDRRLPSYITYHNLRHVKDVLSTCLRYIDIYDIDGYNAELLKIAASAHDYGFVTGPDNHEVRSSAMVSVIMKEHGFGNQECDIVRGLIMATKLPQTPTNSFEEIIADADLDYLGRDDYFEISDTFYSELKYFDKISSKEQWLDLQIGFLESHVYFTDWAKEHRQPGKEERIEQLMDSKLSLK